MEQFDGIFSTEDFRILYFRRYSIMQKPVLKNENAESNKIHESSSDELLRYPYVPDNSGLDVFVYYQARRNTKENDLVVVDCYDAKGRQIQGIRFRLGSEEEILYKGEVRKTKFVLPPGTKSFQFRKPSPDVS
jgi:hypothetical protein